VLSLKAADGAFCAVVLAVSLSWKLPCGLYSSADLWAARLGARGSGKGASVGCVRSTLTEAGKFGSGPRFNVLFASRYLPCAVSRMICFVIYHHDHLFGQGNAPVCGCGADPSCSL